jgi:PTS system mannitol-specific IIC component
VSNTSIEKIPADADVVVTHKNLVDRTRMAHGADLEIVAIENFLGDPALAVLLERLKEANIDAN